MWTIPFHKRNPPSDNASCYRKNALFVKALVGNPPLASYVRRLDYEVIIVPDTNDEDLAETLSAMKMMTQVVDLNGWDGNIGEGQHPSRWKEAMRDFIRGSGLKYLSLRGITFPPNYLPTSLRTLDLEGSSLGFEGDRLKGGPRHRRIELETLWCNDIESLLYFDIYLEEGGQAIRLSKIKNLSLWAHWHVPERWARLLNQTESIQYLRITVHRRVDDSRAEGVPLEGFVQSPLEHVHQASYSTITHLKLDIHGSLVPDKPIIRPYTGVLNEGLTRLDALERLEVDMVLEGRYDLEPMHFNPGEWRSLPLVLQKYGVLPKLGWLSVRVETKLFDPRLRCHPEEPPLTDEEIAEIELEFLKKEAHAEMLVEVMAERTYLRADFQLLLDLRPELDLSFVTAVTLGNRVWRRIASELRS
ncbi:hypothetical protein FA13DRAFT_1724327 [Coprinellus micaceus]|uniref:F-box domain-containing protein n=1 Tax=Coprinellus micaceus TaxID=71717 RepID=A0A4Y7U2T4_COPMI|nr:hypothetical protein FA13DRAFT_1724327 [Coprinellus micaceus]